ncbi:ankyrin repeat and LEM domain-containing protein 2-like isoform X2 [Ptychodera flava]|uniref:ankyrin repeat and LEM domain-containing protein 2-like isoform X2 n=1 Tax=Ptychodera flava TaxID=63121 RepID=UPI003969E40D
MDGIRDEISKLSVSELQRKLRESNLPSGPILPSTRPLFERKLAKFILQSRGGVPAESVPTDATDEDSSNDKDVANGRVTYSDVTPNVQRSGDQPGSNPVSDSDTTVTSRTGCSDGNGNSGSGNTGPVTYYAVCLQRHPSDEIDGEHDAGLLHVYTMKDEALQVVKKNKGSRFKAFKAREDAVNFSQSILMSPPDSCNSPLQTTVAEKPSDFKAPKMQDLVQLRKAIESGNAEKFSDLVWSNPRYLVSSGDSPVILQMGFRYNALHVAAKSNQAEICQLIIDTLMDSKFLYLMYPDDDSNTHGQRMEYLVDLYLNMPDEPVKGNCETPLHFACKFGHVDVVEVLGSHPAVCKTAKNKQGQIPSEIACMRSGSKETKEKIEILLKDQYYVPLLRPDDDVTVGAIGEPWSPSAPIHQSSPLLKQRPRSPMDPVVTVRAYAGPMVSKEQAEEFHKTWKTPPRHSLRTVSQVRREDSDKGLERLGRDIAQSMKLPWMEFWDFLGCYTNLSTPEGLGVLEEYLADRSHTSSGGHCQHKVDSRNSPMSPEALSESDVVKSLTKSLQLAQLNEDEKMDVGTGSEGTEVTSATELLNRIDASVPVLSPGKDEATADIAAQGSSPREQEDAAISMAAAAPDTKSGILNQSMGTDNTQFQEKNTFTNFHSLRTSGHQSDGSTSTDVWKEWRPSQSSTVDSFSSSASGDDGVFRSPETFNSAEGNQGSTSKPDVCLDEAMSKLSLSQSDELQPSVCDPSEDTQSNFYRTSTVSSQRDAASCDSDKQEPSMAKPRLSVNSDGQADITNPKSGDNAHGNDVEMAPAGMQKPVTSPQDRINQSSLANDCFSTPQMSRLNMPGEVSPFGEKIFITGCHPTKLDLDVLRAVNKADSLEEYPHIVKWKSVVNSYSKQTQVSWPSPAASRLRTTSSKQNERKKYSASPVVYQSPLVGWKNSPVGEFKLRHLSEPALKVASPRQRPFPINLSRSFASQL